MNRWKVYVLLSTVVGKTPKRGSSFCWVTERYTVVLQKKEKKNSILVSSPVVLQKIIFEVTELRRDRFEKRSRCLEKQFL